MSPISGSIENPRRHFRLKGPADLPAGKAERIYQLVREALATLYATGGVGGLDNYQAWLRFNRAPYLSKTHGNHYLNNYGNELAADYGKFESSRRLPAGAILVKDSFSMTPEGEILLGPLAVMIKMPRGFNQLSGDWKYLQIQPNGLLLGETGGLNSDRVRYCMACHQARADYDHLFFLPGSYRVVDPGLADR